MIEPIGFDETEEQYIARLEAEIDRLHDVSNDTWTITVRNRWGERVYFAWRLLAEWPSAVSSPPTPESGNG